MRRLRVTKSTTASALVRISLTQGRRPMECRRRSSECAAHGVHTMEGYSAIRSSPSLIQAGIHVILIVEVTDNQFFLSFSLLTCYHLFWPHLLFTLLYPASHLLGPPISFIPSSHVVTGPKLSS
ncbi:hypothetical protein O6H91_19G019500 [Diphasiastrum complanatum]|uniref:Uncharacterized protein n=1 Tax=Diphasiastrum complanatum TaxID=34168 RepID=A0ACC2AT63_DIPCM|nr:hypothetical protein O6H91_19G019500 [Diphasiastrum complanatum]